MIFLSIKAMLQLSLYYYILCLSIDNGVCHSYSAAIMIAVRSLLGDCILKRPLPTVRLGIARMCPPLHAGATAVE